MKKRHSQSISTTDEIFINFRFEAKNFKEPMTAGQFFDALFKYHLLHKQDKKYLEEFYKISAMSFKEILGRQKTKLK